jgi:hypothetical protein
MGHKAQTYSIVMLGGSHHDGICYHRSTSHMGHFVLREEEAPSPVEMEAARAITYVTTTLKDPFTEVNGDTSLRGGIDCLVGPMVFEDLCDERRI